MERLLIWSVYQLIISHQFSHFLTGCTLVHRNPFISFVHERLHTHPTKHTHLISWKCLINRYQRVCLPVSFPQWQLRMNRAQSIIKWKRHDLLMSCGISLWDKPAQCEERITEGALTHALLSSSTNHGTSSGSSTKTSSGSSRQPKLCPSPQKHRYALSIQKTGRYLYWSV